MSLARDQGAYTTSAGCRVGGGAGRREHGWLGCDGLACGSATRRLSSGSCGRPGVLGQQVRGGANRGDVGGWQCGEGNRRSVGRAMTRPTWRRREMRELLPHGSRAKAGGRSNLRVTDFWQLAAGSK